MATHLLEDVVKECIVRIIIHDDGGGRGVGVAD